MANTECCNPAVTYCQPGKRSKTIVERERIGSVPISTRTALAWPQTASLVPPARDDRRSAQERVEAALRADALSVALRQPHRAGSDDPRLAFALGRFCARTWPNDPDFANAMHAGGASYAGDVRAAKVARGFHVEGCAEPDKEPAEEDLSPEGIAAKRADIFGKERALERVDATLREVMPRCPVAMVRLTFEHRDPSPYDEDMLAAGLLQLALLYGHWRTRRS